MPSSITVSDRDRHTVAGLIRRLGTGQPAAEMLVEGSRRRTWGEELDVACRVAQAARRDGLGPGDRVAFLDRNGIAYFDVLFGGSLFGAVNVAVNWRLAPGEMAAIVDDSEAPILVIHPEFLPALSAMPGGLPGVRRIVVLGDDVGSCDDPRVGLVRRLARGLPGRGPRVRGGSRRGEHAALHLGHDRPAQGRDADERQPVHRDLRGGPDLPHRRPDREPGRHALVPHRRARGGRCAPCRGWPVGRSARHGPGAPARPGRHRADHRDVRRPRCPDDGARHPVAGDDGPVQPPR